MSTAEDEFHNGEVAYEQAVRDLIDAAASFTRAARYFAEAGGQTGRRRAAEACERMVRVSDTIEDAQATIAAAGGYQEKG